MRRVLSFGIFTVKTVLAPVMQYFLTSLYSDKDKW